MFAHGTAGAAADEQGTYGFLADGTAPPYFEYGS